MPPSPRQITSLIALSCLACSAVLRGQTFPPTGEKRPPATEKKIYEEWSSLYLAGKRSGFDSVITTREETPSGPHYRTVEEEEFVLKRLGSDLRILSVSKITEDADGAVLSFAASSKGAGSDIESSGVRDGDDLVVSSRGQVGRYKIPRLAALGPAAVERLIDTLPLRPGQIYTIPSFESDYPQAPVILQGSVVAQENRPVKGVVKKLWKITSSNNLSAGLATTLWINDAHQDVESLIKIPGIGTVDERVTSRAECMQPLEGAEILTASLIRPQRAIPSPGQQAQASYRLTIPHGTTVPNLWNEGEQRVTSSGPGVSEFTVTVPTITPADASWQLPHADTPDLHPYLQPSAYLEVDSPEIQELAHHAVGNEKNPVRAAHLIEKFVQAYITKKDLNIGFASAQETARSREGDCTEHAVLCAALGRAVGLPTRCVVGLGYIPPGVDEPTITNAVDSHTGLFGFHMWAEAWIAPHQWVAMDAALGSFDVGHIAITKSALEEVNPLADLNLPILQLLQNIKIEVLRTVPKKAGPSTAPAPSPAATSPSGID